MKRGTAAKVILGKNTLVDVPAGVVHGTDVILGGKAGLLNDFGGLVLSNNLMLGRKISRSRTTTVTVRGQSPLNLPDAIANSLSYVKAFGGTEQRNLPDNYIQRQFIYMMDGSYIWTDIVPESGGKVEMDFQTTTTAAQIASYLGAREPNSPAGNGLRLTHGSIATRPIIIYGFEEGGDYQASAGFSNNTRYKFTYDNGVATIYSGDTLVASHTFTPNSTCTTPLVINGTAASAVSGNIEGIYLYSFKVWNTQGDLVADYVPAVQKGTVPVVGFYDTVSGTFKTATAGTFAAGGEAVPTPDMPMDIISNNGTLKVELASSVDGYTDLEFIQSSGTQWIDLQRALETASDDVEIVFDLLDTSYQENIFGARTDTSRNVYTFAASTTPVWRCGWGSETVAGGAASLGTHKLYINHATAEFSIDGTVIYTGDPSAAITTPRNGGLFAIRASSGGPGYYAQNTRVRSFKLWHDGVLIRDLVPCRRDSDNAIGMRNTLTGGFYPNAGGGEFIAGPLKSSLHTDGTVETINMHGKNLFDVATVGIEQGNIASTTGKNVSSTTRCRTAGYVPVMPSTQYTITANLDGYVGGNSCGIFVYQYNDDASSWVTSGWQNAINGYTFISEPTTTKIRIVFAKAPSATMAPSDVLWVQVERGSTATDYEPYYDGGTATAEMLLSVGDYTDEQEIISGAVTRKVGTLILDGTELWAKESSYSNAFYFDSSVSVGVAYVGLCTHFEFAADSSQIGTTGKIIIARTNKRVLVGVPTTIATTVAAFQQWLSDQYNAGTPVIIVYPLETQTTESVAGQTLQVQDGDNILEITQASLDNLELEAQYKAAVQLTIQEVEDANLDNNVEVTIS